MPSLPEFFAHLAAILRSNGARSVPYVLDIISSASDFIIATNKKPEINIEFAAYLTALLKFDDAKKVATALNISPELIPELQPTLIGVDFQLEQILTRGRHPEDLIAATVLFSWYAAAERVGNICRATSLRDVADRASRNSDLAKIVVEEMTKTSISARPTPSGKKYLFSISIDLVGSTDAKARIMNLAQGDFRRIDQLNVQIYREFCRIEREFYEKAVSHFGSSPAIDPAKFFTVKGIGDEIWILCEATGSDVTSVGYRLIDTAIQIACRSVNFVATEHDDGPSFDANFNYGDIEPIRSPIKIFIDLLSHASDLGRVRDEELAKVIPDLLKTFHKREPSPQETVSVMRRMSLSGCEPVGWWSYHETRTDYIGHEIDRFFRTTKSAIPGTLTIGKSMAEAMGISFKPTAHALHAVLTNDGTPLKGGMPEDPIHARIQTLSREELKGIGYDYATYTLFAPHSLKALYSQMEADARNEMPNMPYQHTAALISLGEIDILINEMDSPGSRDVSDCGG